MPIFKTHMLDNKYPYPEDEVDLLVEDLILDSEVKSTYILEGQAGYEKRKMPTLRKIYLHWGETLVHLNKFDSLFEVEDADQTICWRCGLTNGIQLERAHILARVDGGSDEEANLHLLCYKCHKTSEYLWGREYWEWFMSSIFQTNPHPADMAWLDSRLISIGIDGLAGALKMASVHGNAYVLKTIEDALTTNQNDER